MHAGTIRRRYVSDDDPRCQVCRHGYNCKFFEGKKENMSFH